MAVRKKGTGKKEKAAGAAEPSGAVMKTKDTTDRSALFQGEETTFRSRSSHPKIHESGETTNLIPDGRCDPRGGEEPLQHSSFPPTHLTRATVSPQCHLAVKTRTVHSCLQNRLQCVPEGTEPIQRQSREMQRSPEKRGCGVTAQRARSPPGVRSTPGPDESWCPTP